MLALVGLLSLSLLSPDSILTAASPTGARILPTPAPATSHTAGAPVVAECSPTAARACSPTAARACSPTAARAAARVSLVARAASADTPQLDPTPPPQTLLLSMAFMQSACFGVIGQALAFALMQQQVGVPSSIASRRVAQTLGSLASASALGEVSRTLIGG